MTIDSILIANRGEIARRIMRTCRDLGIDTVAVFTDADAGSPHVHEADTAIRIDDYLRIDAIIDAAQRGGATAIHPGYGFLAENAELARRCAAAELTFIGPSAEAIASMGSKRDAKRLVAAAGVPVVPGYEGDEQSTEALAKHAEAVGFPALIKASAGGGGKGMQVVRDAANLHAAIDSARRIAKNAFGDETLLIERYVENPRHVEVQILGDTHGNVVHLFERECSIQRRHQKIVEESPSPALDADLRARMGEAAIAVARAIDYTNAGTVEFILAPDGAFYFLEVNTRLQVEHPVTELVTGVDLVVEQIRVAEGLPLSFSQDKLQQSGAAIEVRLYAEDPTNEFLPSTGRLYDWHLPALPGVRVDTGVTRGSEVSIHYDPMLAKVIAHGASRAQASRRLQKALRSLSVAGVTTNREMLLAVLRHPEFVAGNTDTHFVQRHPEVLQVESSTEHVAVGLVAVTLAEHAGRVQGRIPSGFRNNRSADQFVELEVDGTPHRVTYRFDRDGAAHVTVDEATSRVTDFTADGRQVSFERDGRIHHARVAIDDDRFHCLVDGVVVNGALRPRFPGQTQEEVAGGLTAPMPGKIVAVQVAVGDAVERAQVLVVLEAMKMEHTVASPVDGSVEQVLVAVGDQVEEGALLVQVTEPEA